MRTAYAIQNSDTGPALLVFPSQEGRNAYCLRAIFTREPVKAISGSEARRQYGAVPSQYTLRANMADDPCCNFHILPILARGY